jgi:hypothetical protein
MTWADFCEAFWKVTAALVCTALFIAIVNQARYNQRRKKWARDIGGTP